VIVAGDPRVNFVTDRFDAAWRQLPSHEKPKHGTFVTAFLLISIPLASLSSVGVSCGSLGCGSCDRPTTSQTVNRPPSIATRHLLLRSRPSLEKAAPTRLRPHELHHCKTNFHTRPLPACVLVRCTPQPATPILRPLTPSFSSLTTNAVTHRDIASRFPSRPSPPQHLCSRRVTTGPPRSGFAACRNRTPLQRPSPPQTLPRLTPSPPPQA